ncbi:MAG: heme biosynthesis HemY N-terminal domain-containing protein [Pseudomonadota bacterium]
MIVLFFIIALLCIAGVFVLWASRLPGALTLDLGNGAVYEFEVVYAILAIILLGAAIALIWSFLTGLVTLPRRFSRSRKAAKVESANKALADGLLAAEAGDAALAKKMAKKSAQYASDDRMKLLLEARTAEISDDWSGAERAWGQLTRLPGGKLAGLRGAASAASARGDMPSAETRAREALELKTAADWPFNTLFDSQIAAGQWRAALETLTLGAKRGHIKGDALRQRRAVLYTALSTELPHEQRKDAQRLLAEAIKAAPGFPPAAWHGAQHLMSDGKIKSAQGVLELAWKARPHPALAQLARQLSAKGSERSANTRLNALIAINPEHRESRILKAEIAMADKDWLSAVKELALLVEEKPTARLSLLLANALDGYGDSDEATRWRALAATAAREPEWSDLTPRGKAFDYNRADWSRLVYEFGDTGRLIHPRYEVSERELEAGKPLALPGAVDKGALDAVPKAPSAATATPPTDFAQPKETSD